MKQPPSHRRPPAPLLAAQRLMMLAGMALAITAIRRELRRPKAERAWHGTVLGVPYDFRPPTPARIKAKWWNADSDRLFTPHTFGVGWSLNLHRLLRRGEHGGHAETA